MVKCRFTFISEMPPPPPIPKLPQYCHNTNTNNTAAIPKGFPLFEVSDKKLSQPQYVRYVCWYYCIKSTQAWITRNYYRLGSTFLIYCISEKSISCGVDWTDDDNVVRWIRKSDERTRREGKCLQTKKTNSGPAPRISQNCSYLLYRKIVIGIY